MKRNDTETTKQNNLATKLFVAFLVLSPCLGASVAIQVYSLHQLGK
jgi:hypothetical protein